MECIIQLENISLNIFQDISMIGMFVYWLLWCVGLVIMDDIRSTYSSVFILKKYLRYSHLFSPITSHIIVNKFKYQLFSYT